MEMIVIDLLSNEKLILDYNYRPLIIGYFLLILLLSVLIIRTNSKNSVKLILLGLLWLIPIFGIIGIVVYLLLCTTKKIEKDKVISLKR